MSVVTYTCFDGELVEENRDGTILDYVPDSLGSIIMWVDETGLPASYTPYWPYGEPWQEPEVECPFQFVGTFGYYRDLSGTYVRARTYEPEIGRWLTVDPLWPKDAPYQYAWCNPITIYDPSGLSPLWCDSCMMEQLKNPRKTMFGACMACNRHLGVTEATAKCKKYPTKPLPRSTFGFFSALSGDCCANSSGVYDCDSCCLQINGLLGTSTFIGGLFSDPRIPSCASCLLTCQDACHGEPTPGKDVLAGLKACLAGPKLDLLDFVLIFLESQ